MNLLIKTLAAFAAGTVLATGAFAQHGRPYRRRARAQAARGAEATS
jgi:hypothetical protein